MPKEIIRKLTVTGAGRSYYVTLPKEMVQELKWKKGQRVVVERNKEGIVIKDWKRN